MPADETSVPDPFGGATIINLAPGQKYAVTFPLGGVTTCLRCGALIDDQLTGVHDKQHGD